MVVVKPHLPGVKDHAGNEDFRHLTRLSLGAELYHHEAFESQKSAKKAISLRYLRAKEQLS